MKKIFFILTILTCVTITACRRKDTNSSYATSDNAVDRTTVQTTDIPTTSAPITEPLKTFDVNEDSLLVLNENDYANAEIVEMTDEIVLYKPFQSISSVYPNIKLYDFEYPEDFIANCVDQEGNWYSAFQTNPAVDNGGEIRKYHPQTKEIQKFLTPENDNACGCVYLKDNYLIWQEASSYYWLKTTYHIHNLETGEDIKYYTDAVDPKTNESYHGMHFNTPVILHDILYFDDTIARENDGFPHTRIFSYDLKTNDLETFYDNALWPLEYKDEIAWFSMSKDRTNGIFCTEQDGGLFKSTVRLGSVPSSKGNLVALNDRLSESTLKKIIEGKDTSLAKGWENDLDELTIGAYGVNLFQNNHAEPLFVTKKGYASNVILNERYVTWVGNQIGIPMLYDIQNDRLLYFDMLNEDDVKNIVNYSFEFLKNQLILSYSVLVDEEYITKSFSVSLE